MHIFDMHFHLFVEKHAFSQKKMHVQYACKTEKICVSKVAFIKII